MHATFKDLCVCVRCILPCKRHRYLEWIWMKTCARPNSRNVRNRAISLWFRSAFSCFQPQLDGTKGSFSTNGLLFWYKNMLFCLALSPFQPLPKQHENIIMNIWWFPKIGLPPVIIQMFMGFSRRNHPSWGTPMTLEPPEKFRFIFSIRPGHCWRCTSGGCRGP